MTSIDFSLRATRIARHSWVNSSMMLSMRILPAVMGAVLDEVVGPDVVAVLRPQPDARSVGQPQPAALGLFGGDLQPLAPPDPLDPLVVDQPAGPAQQLGDLAIAVAAILPGQLDDVGRQPLLVVTAPRDLALRRAMLPERRTGATLGHVQLRVEHARCRHGDARGLEVSPGGLLQDQLVQRQVRDRLAQPAVLVSRSFRRFTWSLFNPPHFHCLSVFHFQLHPYPVRNRQVKAYWRLHQSTASRTGTSEQSIAVH